MDTDSHPVTDRDDRDESTSTRGAGPAHLAHLDLEPPGHPVRFLRQRGHFWAVLAIGAALVIIAGLLLRAEPGRDTTETGAGTASTGPGTTVPAPPTAGPAARAGTIRDVDLRNATYPSTACPPDYRLPGATFTLADGRAGSPPDLLGQPWPDDPRGVDLHAVAYGDVTGDGAEEAAVILRCYRPNSDAISRGLVVLGLAGDQMVTLATLPTSGTRAAGTFVVVDDDRSPIRLEQRGLEYDLAEEARVVAGQLVVRWRQSSLGGDAFGHGYDVTVVYRIGRDGATVVGEPTRVVVPYDDEPGPAGLGIHAIRAADLRSLTLPLAADGRDPTSGRLCPTLFDPLGPVADAVLHDGAATVTTADGTPLDASVRIEDVRFGLVDHDPYEDAVVLVRCTAGSRSAQSAVIVRWLDGAAVLGQVLGEPGHDGYTTVEGRVGGFGRVELTLDRLVGGVPDPATRTGRVYGWAPAEGRLR